jgi:hypothetical protein
MGLVFLDGDVVDVFWLFLALVVFDITYHPITKRTLRLERTSRKLYYIY